MARHPLAFQSVCKSSLPLSRAETAELQSLGGGLVHLAGPNYIRRTLFNIDYILLENQCDKADKADKPKRGRNKFFDLGCTTYGDWDGDPSRPLEASGSGPSIPLFFSWYRENCVEFDDIYAWEGAHHRPAAWWRHVPPFLRPRRALAALFPATLPASESKPHNILSHPHLRVCPGSDSTTTTSKRPT